MQHLNLPILKIIIYYYFFKHLERCLLFKQSVDKVTTNIRYKQIKSL